MAKTVDEKAKKIEKKVNTPTAPEVANAKSAELLKAKADEEKKIRDCIAENERILQTIDKDIKEAVREADPVKYADATNKKRMAKSSIEMYQERLKLLESDGFGFISEKESDQVIDSLLEYADKLDNDFRNAINEELPKLEKLLKKYREDVFKNEQALHNWQHNIYANYRLMKGTIKYSEDGTRVFRNEKPREIRALGAYYTGCGESNEVRDFVLSMEKFKDGKLAMKHYEELQR